ncbi:MAG: hypothetical protein EBU62_13160 [Proteobacteria bacterium]|nr:hypothetical protein [Pseudomonadota bacterium]
MSDLRAAEVPGGTGSAPNGPGATGYGIDLPAEVERLRATVMALAVVVTEIQSRLNAHTHGGATPVLPAGERATTPFIPG